MVPHGLFFFFVCLSASVKLWVLAFFCFCFLHHLGNLHDNRYNPAPRRRVGRYSQLMLADKWLTFKLFLKKMFFPVQYVNTFYELLLLSFSSYSLCSRVQDFFLNVMSWVYWKDAFWFAAWWQLLFLYIDLLFLKEKNLNSPVFSPPSAFHLYLTKLTRSAESTRVCSLKGCWSLRGRMFMLWLFTWLLLEFKMNTCRGFFFCYLYP